MTLMDLQAGTKPPTDRTSSKALTRAAVERMADTLTAQHYSPRTIEAYLSWMKRFVSFHRPRDLGSLGADEVRSFLSALAVRGKVSASTQNQARSALAFFYRHVQRRPLAPLEGVTPASRPGAFLLSCLAMR